MNRVTRTARELLCGIIIVVIVLLVWSNDAPATDVTYCQDLETGEVIVVPAGEPCPFPMAEI